MYSKILIRYGELSLKGKNKMLFVRHLEKNLNKIHNLFPQVTFDRMYLAYSKENMDELKNVVGISSFSPVEVIESNYDSFRKCLLEFIQNKKGTFKIKARRSWKQFSKTSQDINIDMGEFVLNNSKLTVDVRKPDYLIEIEIHENETYIFDTKIAAIGGLPVGVNGKVLHLISGGIDSPVAAYELIKRGIHIDFLSFITPPQTDQTTVDKIKKIIKLLGKYQGVARLYFAKYTLIMQSLSLMSKQSYKITLMRRSFYRIATSLTTKNHYATFSNGENLGQVASQTLESIQTIQDQTNYPVLRPVLTNDKIDTINLAIKIGTYEISIIPAKETCELFAPKRPVIQPTIHDALKCEEEFPEIFNMEAKLIKDIEVLKI